MYRYSIKTYDLNSESTTTDKQTTLNPVNELAKILTHIYTNQTK